MTTITTAVTANSGLKPGAGERSFHWLARIYYRLFGNKRLRHYEKLCLDAWRVTLTDRFRVMLNSQLATIDLVKRRAGGTSVYFYEVHKRKDPREQSLLFPNPAPACQVAEVVLAVEGAEPAKTIVARIFVHRGRLWAITFSQRPDRQMKSYGPQQPTLRATQVTSIKALE